MPRDVSQTPDELLDQLAEDYIARLREGQEPTLDEYCLRYPELADDIRELLPTLAMLEQVAPEAEPQTGRLDGVPDRIGDYSVIREIGRGGMGIVYEARHDALRRRVALKVLPPKAAEKQSNIDRFLREARAAGRLHHTNVVPVFEVGFRDGLHFYSMQFIEGQNLDTIIDELRLLQSGDERTVIVPAASVGGDSVARQLMSTQTQVPGESTEIEVSTTKSATLSGFQSKLTDETTTVGYFHRVAQVGMQLCEGLAYAHGQGILHRDIKPSNLLLDSAGVVWITDFGLAKAEGEDLTHTGDIVGTLRYMAPERFNGVADARSDLFSVGLALYELCTLQPAYDQTDRANIMRAITNSSPIPPRVRNPEVPRDLETLILKLTERSPEHRYQSATEAAEDFRLFLADRPVLARRSTPIERLFRWSRRNPALAGLIACVCLLIGLLMAGAVAYGLEMEERSKELAARTTEAERAKKAAEDANLEMTRQTFMANYNQAKAQRFSGRLGQHFESLAALNRAADTLPSLNLDEAGLEIHKRMLRKQVMAALPLTDFRPENAPTRLPPSRPNANEQSSTVDIDAVTSDFRYRAIWESERLVVTRDGKQVFSREDVQAVQGLRLSPNGRFLLVAHGTPSVVFRVWDTLSGRETVTVPRCRGLQRVGISNQLIAYGAADSQVVVADIATGETGATATFQSLPRAIVFQRGSNRLGIAAGRELSIWDPLTEDAPTRVLQADVTLHSIAIGPKHICAGTHNGPILVWSDYVPALKAANTEDGPLAPSMTLSGHTSRVSELLLSPVDPILASDSWDGAARFWNLQTGEQLLRIDGGEIRRFQAKEVGAAISYPGFSDDGRTIASRYQSKATIKATVVYQSARTTLRNPGRKGRVWDVLWHNPTGALFVSTDEGIEIWDVERRKVVQQNRDGIVRSMFLSDDGRSLLTSGISGIRRWPIQFEPGTVPTLGEPKVLLAGHFKRLTMSADGRRAVADKNFRAHLLTIDGDTITDEGRIAPHSGLDRVALTPDGKWLITSTWAGTGVIVWDVETREKVVDLVPDSGNATVAVSPDGRFLIATTQSATQVVWEVGTWKKLKELPRMRADDWPGPIGFSADNKYLAVSETRFSSRLLSLPDLEPITTIPADLSPTTLEAFAFDADNTHLAIGLRENIEVWDLATVRERLESMSLNWRQ